MTRGAVAAADGESPDPEAAAVWGLVRSAQTEHPGRFVLVDVDAGDPAAALVDSESQVALRDGALLAPRLVREKVYPTPTGAWRLGVERAGSLDGVRILAGDGDRPLSAGEVRISMRAAGVNFRDVVGALGIVLGRGIGLEGAGVITEVGADVRTLGVGDCVMGLVPDAFAPLAVADQRMLVPVPDGWSFARAASVPVAFVTAHYGLAEVARLQPGERVLIHAAAGGVGLAAVQLAQSLGAEVFATASPWKWPVLRALGLDDQHLASSRTTAFREDVLAATDGAGVDVVLNALAGEYTDASLDLLVRGGRFVEMGKTDIRAADDVAARYPGVRYRAIDIFEAGPDRWVRCWRTSSHCSLAAPSRRCRSPRGTCGRAPKRCVSSAKPATSARLSSPSRATWTRRARC